MTDEPRCECDDLPISMCGRAIEQRQAAERKAEQDRLRAAGWWPANYAGRCVRCGEWFEADSLIWSDTHRGGYLAECCS